MREGRRKVCLVLNGGLVTPLLGIVMWWVCVFWLRTKLFGNLQSCIVSGKNVAQRL